MAVSLLAALIAIGLLHLQPQLAHWRGDGGFRRWVEQVSDTSGTGRTLLALLVPVALCLVMFWLISLLPMADLFRLTFSLLVLIYAFGPHAYEADLEAILRAPDGASREAATQALSEDGEPVAWNAIAVGEAVAYAALRRRFGVLLWFFILGPAGALFYRLSQSLAHGAFDLDQEAKKSSETIANFLDWLPAQLLVFTLALVGHWDAVVHAWRQWHAQANPGSWLRDGPGFLGAAARADIQVDIEAGDGYAEERSDVLAELRRIRSIFVRALLAWLSVVALIVIAGWLG